MLQVLTAMASRNRRLLNRKVFLILIITLVLIVSYECYYRLKTFKPDSSLIEDEEEEAVNTTKKGYVPYTSEDPSNYSGPILAGWPPEKSRNVSLYLRPDEDTVLSDISCMDFRGVRLFVVVQSAPFQFVRRQIVRDTYMRFTENLTDIKVIFLFGTSEDQNQTRLDEEQLTFCDVIQADYVDSYENVTLDTLTIFKLALTIRWRPEKPKFLVIADDDSYLNLRGIYAELFLNENAVLKENDTKLLGYQLLPYIHYPEAVWADRAILPKNPFPYSPRYMYNQSLYPPFLTGGGYVVPFKSVPCLYRKGLALPLYHINDVFVTGFVRQACNIDIVADRRFLPNRMNFIILTYDIFMYHQGTDWGRQIMDYVVRIQDGNVENCTASSYCIRDKVLLWCEATVNDCQNVSIPYNQL